jgi:hypothetical protein
MSRFDILETAIEATQSREVQFGSPENNLGVAADLWTQYLKQIPDGKITAQDVTMMMVLFKVARLVSGKSGNLVLDEQVKKENIKSQDDTLRDIAGYAAIASELHH